METLKARELKEKCEDEISRIIASFQAVTGLKISNVHFNTIDVKKFDGDGEWLPSVSLEVRL